MLVNRTLSTHSIGLLNEGLRLSKVYEETWEALEPGDHL